MADDGTVHVAWTMGGAVYHASTKLGGSSTVEKVFDLGTTVEQAGPLGRPGITLDGDGAPWIAFTAETSKGQDVHVAHLDRHQVGRHGRRDLGRLQRLPLAAAHGHRRCGRRSAGGLRGSCGRGGRVGHAPRLDMDDHAGRQPMPAGSASPSAQRGDTAYAAYYTGAGKVDVATWKDGAWTTAKVADTADPDATATGNAAPSTAVTVDASGTVYVAWEDSGIQLWSDASGSFASVDVGHEVSTGSDPSLAASDNGVALAWYETTQQNQMIGFLGDLADVLVAQPSPSLTVSQGPAGGRRRAARTARSLSTWSRKDTAFEVTCLVAAAGQPFTINFDNQDAGIPHNIAIFKDSSATPALCSRARWSPDRSRPRTTSSRCDAGTYFFHCDVHPTMTGHVRGRGGRQVAPVRSQTLALASRV